VRLDRGQRARRRRLALWAGIVLAVLLAWFAVAGRVLVVSGDPDAGDAVVVLSGDPLGGRVQAGAATFRQSGAELLVVMVASTGPVYDPRDDLLRFLTRGGIDESAVRFVGPATSTADEAGLIAGLARRCGWRRIVIVTSPYHTRRARWLFDRALSDTHVAAVASEEPAHRWTWWAHESDTEAVLLEWVKGLASLRYLLFIPATRDPGVAC
jgi:uncharacterized SAM-binding protein YcdF (DUF218 family)